MAVTIEQFMDALSGQESGGDYTAQNGRTGAYGRFQIMQENWAPWAREAGLPAGAQPTPQNQERVARFKLQQYYDRFGNWADVAAAWYSGSPLGAYTPEQLNRKQGRGDEPSIAEYVNQVMGRMGAQWGGSGWPGRGPYAPEEAQPNTAGLPDYSGMADHIDQLLREWVANEPDPRAPKYQTADAKKYGYYASDKSAWLDEAQSLVALRNALQTSALGLLTLPDGTVIPMGEATPEQRDQVERANRTQYAAILNQFGLDEYSLDVDYTAGVNDTLNTGFDNQISGFNAQIASDQLDISRFSQDLQKWMAGQEIASGDATRIAAAKQEARMYGTSGGKKDFSGHDLGAGVSMLARQAGIDPAVPLLRYPGTQTLDPVGDRLNSLATMGVQNAPPLLPPRTAPTVVPTAPALLPPPPPPQLIKPDPWISPQGVPMLQPAPLLGEHGFQP